MRSVSNSGSYSTMPRHASRLGVEQEPRQRNAVAADIGQSAAADVGLVANIRRVVVVVGERTTGSCAARRCLLRSTNRLARLPLRMVAIHEGFHDLQLRKAARRVDQLLPFGGRQADRLFAQHVLAGLERRDRPGHVQVIGQRVVDRVDVRIGQQFFVRAVGLGDAQSFRPRLGPGPDRARRWPRSRSCAAALHGRNDFLDADLGRAQNSPA